MVNLPSRVRTIISKRPRSFSSILLLREQFELFLVQSGIYAKFSFGGCAPFGLLGKSGSI